MGRHDFHIEIGWMVVAAACLMSLVVAALTMSYESIKPAMGNPVKALKDS